MSQIRLIESQDAILLHVIGVHKLKNREWHLLRDGFPLTLMLAQVVYNPDGSLLLVRFDLMMGLNPVVVPRGLVETDGCKCKVAIEVIKLHPEAAVLVVEIYLHF